MFVLPFQNPFQEFFAAKIATRHAFVFAQPFLDRRLSPDAGVVRSRQPQNFITPHPRAPRQNVLNGVVKHVTQGKDTGDIWWRDHDREPRLRRFGVGTKCLSVEPALIPLWLNCFWIVSFRQLRHGDTVAQASRL